MSIDKYGNEHLRDDVCRILAMVPDRAKRDDALAMLDRLADNGQMGSRLQCTWEGDSRRHGWGEVEQTPGLAAMFGASCEEGCVWRALRLKQVKPEKAKSTARNRLVINRETMLVVVRGIAEYVATFKMIVEVTCKQSFGRLPGVIYLSDISDGSDGASAIVDDIAIGRLAEIAIGGNRCMGNECYVGRFEDRCNGHGDEEVVAAIAAIETIQAFAEGAAETFYFRWDKKQSRAVVEFGDSEWPLDGVVDASLEYAAKKKAPRKPKTDDDRVADIVMGINRDFAKKHPSSSPHLEVAGAE